jgi:hypothetical protein
MILLYLFFGLLIAYAIRLYMKRNEPFKPIKPEDLKKNIYKEDEFPHTFSLDKEWNVSNMMSGE